MSEETAATLQGRDTRQPIVVAIGASAGGIKALQAFFDEVPPQTGAAFVVVVHLDPQRRSELPNILATRTHMPVVPVEAQEQLKVDHVYVIPPDRRLQVINHEIRAVPFDEPPSGHRTAIDLFFRSVAERLGDGFAVILSGAGSDGAVGVKAVKEAGGIILVQEPDEAEYSSMPRSAIATGVADFVLPVHDLVLRLIELIALKRSGAIPPEPPGDEESLRRILAHVRIRTGHDFGKYKRSTVLRRLARRMQVTRAENLREYYEVLRDRNDEAPALLTDLLISVTTFFRDEEAFSALARLVLPKLFGRKDPNDTVRIWVPGCATGEEAYTIAMLLLEETSRHDIRPSIQVFGSDLDARALVTAREGRYAAAIEADVSQDRLRRFFVREGDGYRVRPELRDLVLFAVHDLLKDPPFSRLDLISCRNLLIYLDRELQEQVCTTFHYSLNPGGFLLLGSSETADNPAGLFRVLERGARIYQSTARQGDKPRLLPRLLGSITAREVAAPLGRAASPGSALTEAVRHRNAIEQVAPPSVLVDETHRVIHLSETAGRFIAPSGGTLSGDVVDLVRPELRFELRSALHRAFEQNASSLSLPIPVRFNGAPHRVHLLVKPSRSEMTEAGQAVVIFIEGEAIDQPFADSPHQNAADETVRRLTQELELSRVRLRTMREESEAANEELRAANEELQSINEEYRSTSEELETSKEELQSINEELQTVNSELKLKLEAISRAHSDLQNLMAATDFGTLFLDGGLRIKRFTDHVTELFSITPSDEGRPITDFAHQLEYNNLIADTRQVLSDLAPVRREVRSRSGRWYDVRMRPYRTIDDKIDGVVLTFVEITERLEVEESLRESERHLRQQKRLVELSRTPIFIWQLDGEITDWNRGSEELYGYSRSEAIGRRKEELLGPGVPPFEQLKAELLKEGSWSGERRHRTKDGRELIVESRLQLESFDGHQLVLESTRDITEIKSWERRQDMLRHELSHRMKNTLAMVQVIAHQTRRASSTPEEFVQRLDGRLAALASAHDLLMQSNWQSADLATLVRGQVEPYTSDRTDRLRLHGEPVDLPADLATPLGLVLHELAINAGKYGALSNSGRVELQWQLTGGSDRVLELVWREEGGPRVSPPTKVGLGSLLIERAIPNASVKREFRADGVICAIHIALPDSGGEDSNQP
ncbi:MAG: PAS domain-containing protein [Acetobacteraceae bacterium]|nr:PAS domain-containing protein [Acetobacteraceae bacterium]